jgi:hypothetical protein
VKAALKPPLKPGLKPEVHQLTLELPWLVERWAYAISVRATPSVLIRDRRELPID